MEDAANIEISVCTGDKKFESVDEDVLKRICATIKAEKEAEEAKKKKKKD